MNSWLEVRERSAIALARRRVRAVAQALSFSEHDAERAAIVVTEAATNLVRYARQGEILIGDLTMAAHRALAIVSADRGPGISNLDRMMVDGASTAQSQSQGTGLGAMQRLSDAFDVYTNPTEGTVITMRIDGGDRAPAQRKAAAEIGALMVDCPGQTVCGDAWAVREGSSATEVLVCDGLGHGPRAHEAAAAVVGAFNGLGEHSALDRFDVLSDAAQPTRGAVALVCAISHQDPVIRYAGMGNVSAVVMAGGKGTRLVSRDGRLGASGRSAHVHEAAFDQNAVLIMHTDGVRTLRDLERRSALMHRAPLTIAATLLRDGLRGNDDACVAVARRAPQQGR